VGAVDPVTMGPAVVAQESPGCEARFQWSGANAGVARVAGAVPPSLHANVSASFLLAALSKVTDAVST
jgi:hypothetical protein